MLSQEEAGKKIKRLGGYDKLYRIKFEADYLEKLTMEGAKERYGDPLPADVAERLKFELYIMKTMGFPGYFLIVQDFINTSRNELGVSIGRVVARLREAPPPIALESPGSTRLSTTYFSSVSLIPTVYLFLISMSTLMTTDDTKL